MTIRIVQSCDKCSERRTLSIRQHGDQNTIRQAASADGWMILKETKHLCTTCVDQILT